MKYEVDKEIDWKRHSTNKMHSTNPQIHISKDQSVHHINDNFHSHIEVVIVRHKFIS